MNQAQSGVDESIEFAWGRQLRQFREGIRATQRALADQMNLICHAVACGDDAYARYASFRFECPEGFAGYDIARFEGDPKRLPVKRNKHLLILAALIDLGARLDAAKANAWLESGEQGWLSARECAALFSPV